MVTRTRLIVPVYVHCLSCSFCRTNIQLCLPQGLGPYESVCIHMFATCHTTLVRFHLENLIISCLLKTPHCIILHLIFTSFLPSFLPICHISSLALCSYILIINYYYYYYYYVFYRFTVHSLGYLITHTDTCTYILFKKSKIYIKTFKTLLHVSITRSSSGILYCSLLKL